MQRAITGHTQLGCLLGSPVRHSLSPAMYNDTFSRLGMDKVYLCFELLQEQLPGMVESLRVMEVFGFNLTMPLKTAVVPLLDHLSAEAALIGAVNTVKNESGVLTGYNTDGTGYLKSVRMAGVELAGAEMTLLGTGGAASAIAAAAALGGVKKLHLVNRKSGSWEKAGALAARINRDTPCEADLTDLGDARELQRLLERSVLLTNATSVGMDPKPGMTPLPEGVKLPPELFVSDIIYHPPVTKLLADAARAGCRTKNGLDMLLYQGEEAFRIWTGAQMPVEWIRERYFKEE